MNAGRTVFSQLIEFLPHQEFQKWRVAQATILRVPLDKSEGVVKQYLSQAVREHRFFYQRG